jgi:3-oxoacyl-(acyl-carrier-protein) synthase
MSLGIVGMGWVTPLGSGLDFVWQRLLQGEEASATTVSEESLDRVYNVFRVPESALKSVSHPRLRRASAISRFAAAAGLHALESAGLRLGVKDAERVALIFAISNGGVAYTKRFYREIINKGAQAASPLLFPETVFNAPASHLAAILGLTGASYTLVGDGSVGLAAIGMAEDLMHNQALDYCLVVGTEEIDWLLCDAYRRWRLLRLAPPIEPFGNQSRGMVLSEGAGAVLLARNGRFSIESVHPGEYFATQSQAVKALERIVRDLAKVEIDLVISSANGTFIDRAESRVIQTFTPNAVVYTGKPALGESVGAAGLWQVIIAAQALSSAEIPPVLHADSTASLRLPRSRARIPNVRNAIVLSCGLNQQATGLRLAIG